VHNTGCKLATKTCGSGSGGYVIKLIDLLDSVITNPGSGSESRNGALVFIKKFNEISGKKFNVLYYLLNDCKFNSIFLSMTIKMSRYGRRILIQNNNGVRYHDFLIFFLNHT
jgi:hypothetical protein